jgi:hypothetical protein
MESDNRHRMHWLLIKSFIEVVVLSGGVVFGGAVRDWILHDHFSKLFYRYFWAHPDHATNGVRVVNEKFQDKTFHPESIDRLTIPRDVDMVIRKSMFSKLTDKLQEKGFYLQRIHMEQPVDEYLVSKTGIPAGSIKHERYFVDAVNPAFDNVVKGQFADAIRHDVGDLINKLFFTLRLQRFAADVIVIDDDNCNISIGPVGRIDFDVNSLVWDANGVHTSSLYMKKKTPLQTHTHLTEIIDNIIQKRAIIMLSPFQDQLQQIDRRVRKLLSKGWSMNLASYLDTVTVECDRELYTGVCLCCQAPFSEFDRKYFKMRCCDARCHSASCMLQIIKNHCKVKGTCPLCRHDWEPSRGRVLSRVGNTCIDETLLGLIVDYPKQTMCWERSLPKDKPALKRSTSM